jgi:hypothetical protein
VTGAGAAADCDLCEAARITACYHEDEVCWVADCEACSVPMVVWRRHGTDPSEAELDHMIAELTKAADGVLGQGCWSVDFRMRQIPDHFHAHARDPNWWVRRLAGFGGR